MSEYVIPAMYNLCPNSVYQTFVWDLTEITSRGFIPSLPQFCTLNRYVLMLFPLYTHFFPFTLYLRIYKGNGIEQMERKEWNEMENNNNNNNLNVHISLV